MKFKIQCEDNEKIDEYIDRSHKHFEKDKTAQQYVKRDIMKKKKGCGLVDLDITFWTIFEDNLFYFVAFYFLFIGVTIGLLFSNFIFILIGLFGAGIIAFVPLMQNPRVVFLFIKYQMRKIGYKGFCKYGGKINNGSK